VIYTPLEDFISSHTHLPLFATVLDGIDVRLQAKIEQGMVLIGNESRGISTSLLQAHKNLKRITIPGKGSAESLNAAVAAGIVLSHLLP
jgi:TrmH family RNA methyltransferase